MHDGGHESNVDLLLQPCYGVKRSGPAYEEAALQAARGWGEGRGHVKIVHLLPANGEFTDLAQLLYVARSRQVYVELVVETLLVVYSIRVVS